MGTISEGFVLRKVTSFAATMGLILAPIANLPHSASAANRGGLWAVVHDICVPAYQSIGVGFPCAEVSIADGLERGFAVLRLPSSATHVIVVPTTRISGIESPALLKENAPSYWQAAWGARRFVEEGARRRLPRDKIGMAINSVASRSQEQLHIHVACIAPAVADFLRRHQAEIHRAWSFLSAPLLGQKTG
jgi:CDP-diacylglycerol pyrophosphatase